MCVFEVQLFEQFCQVYVLGLTVSCYRVIYVARPAEEVLLVRGKDSLNSLFRSCKIVKSVVGFGHPLHSRTVALNCEEHI